MKRATGGSALEMWAGLEATVNRIGDRYMDQCALNGHDQRETDLQKFASLGVQVIRYPALWEKVETKRGIYDWAQTDKALALFQQLGLKPIIGFVHHGSGPNWTSLLDDHFPLQLAAYAAAFAKRYPWVRDYTPINEPLTTARFSCLYGAWFPHHRSNQSFVRAVYLQMKAISLSMTAIRAIAPNAKLIQTEDLGRAIGTEKLQYQVEFENHRRWLTFDFLNRRVDSQHALAKYLLRNGLPNEERDWLLENAVAPDVIGINHYLLSNRFLDDQIKNYPVELHGGNGRHRYVDVGAAHFAPAQNTMVESLLREVAGRYIGQNIAVTEVHLDGTRESQLRWLVDVWAQCLKLREEGLPILAVTAWSLLGNFNWNSLCTRDDNYYESGIFDVRTQIIRPTAVARIIQKITSHRSVQTEPVLSQAGWWRFSPASGHGANLAPFLITGGQGVLAVSIAKLCEARGLRAVMLGRQELDIGDSDAIGEALRRLKPWAVINAAGYTQIDKAQLIGEASSCHATNVLGAENLARACARYGARFVTFSSNFVFNGQSAKPYVESDSTAPLNVYGQTQMQADKGVLELNPDALIIRTSALFGPWDEKNFITQGLRRIKRGDVLKAFNNVTVSPTYIPDLVNATLDLLIDHESGLLHLNNQGAATWAELAQFVVGGIGFDKALIREIAYDPGDTRAAPRPLYSAMTSERALYLPDYQSAIERYFKDLAVAL